jgi:CPA1 family monovalent cation:H+ antiporter
MGSIIELLVILMLISAIVAIITRRMHLPYTVGLVITGLLLAVTPHFQEVRLSKDLIYMIFLPPLIFEAAIHISWKDFSRDLGVITVLATLGVVLSAVVTALGMHYLVGWGFTSALVFGTLIAATDPVSVIATFKEVQVDERLHLLVEEESLLNDGTAAAAFAIALAIAMGGSFDGTSIAMLTLKMIAGGIVCGTLVAAGALLLTGRTVDPLVEIMLSIVVAYGSFLLAEHLHVSGVLATLTAGMVIRNSRTIERIPAEVRAQAISFWEAVAFIVNSFVFILIGIHRAHFGLTFLQLMPIALVLVMLGRAVAIYPCCVLFAGSSKRVPLAYQHILVWGGLRGALALTLALSLPPDLPHYEEILYVSFAVVAFSILVQGVTMMPLLRKLRLIGDKSKPGTA